MDRSTPEPSFYAQVFAALEEIRVRYMIVGGFAARVFGSTRNTHDVDLVVALDAAHIMALARKFPLPRYYADPEQMRNSVELGLMFNIIDTNTGDKVDLIPLKMNAYNARAMERRLHLPFEDTSGLPIEGWFGRPDDIIIGKMHAWDWNGSHSNRHETDIGQMLVAIFTDPDTLGKLFEESYADQHIRSISPDAWSLWVKLKRAARAEAEKHKRKRRVGPVLTGSTGEGA